MIRLRLNLLVLALSLSAGASAQKLYKSVDEAGNVTYSDTPPAEATEVEKVQAMPGPSAEQVEEARQRLEQTKQAAGEMEQSRRARQEQTLAPLDEERSEVKELETSGTSIYGGGRYPEHPIEPVPPGPGFPRPPIRPGPPSRPLPPVQTLPAR